MNLEWQRIRKAEYHDDGCPQPQPKLIPMKLGDQLAHCSACLSRWITVTPRPASVAVQAQEPRSGYVCRQHWTPVTWAGRGCAPCRVEADARARRRARSA